MIFDMHTVGDWIERHAGPLAAWLASAVTWLAGGSPPLAVIGTLLALWWTVERILTEREKRRAISDYRETERMSASRLMSRLEDEDNP